MSLSGSNHGGSIFDDNKSRYTSRDNDDAMSVSSRGSKSSRRSKKSIGSSISKRLRSRSRSRDSHHGGHQEDSKFHAWGQYVNSNAGQDILF